MTDIQSQISDIQSQLESAYPPDEAKALAWWILEETTGLSRSQLLSGCKITKNISNLQEKTDANGDLQEIITRLLNFEPVQYIFGHTLWSGLDLLVTPTTLIPRPETAELVERINEKMVNEKMVKCLDIGTGSGCIAIALKKQHPEWSVTGIDISPEAIEVARQNATRNNVEVNFQVADIFDCNEEIFNFQFSIFNLIVSNPPYVRESEKSSMKSNVLDHEPASALFVPDSDPLRFYRRIAELFVQRPMTNDQRRDLFFEINENLSVETENLLRSLGYSDIQTFTDIYSKPRFIHAIF